MWTDCLSLLAVQARLRLITELPECLLLRQASASITRRRCQGYIRGVHSYRCVHTSVLCIEPSERNSLDFETDLPTFMRKVEEDAASFKPFGEKIHEYTKRLPSADGKETEEAQFEVWHVRHNPHCFYRAKDMDAKAEQSTFDTPGFSEYHKRMQLFILLYIEGGSYIDEDNAWEFVCLYVSAVSPSLLCVLHDVGVQVREAPQAYSILRPALHLRVTKRRVHLPLHRLLLPVPLLLLPREGPHAPQPVRHPPTLAIQGPRLYVFSFPASPALTPPAAALYQAIYALTLARPTIAELTVEDPAEAFEDLRDRNDLRMLVAHKEFCAEAFGEGGLGGGVGPVRHGKSKGKARAKAGKMGPPVDKAWMERWRVQLKIAGVSRVLLLLSAVGGG